jgi:hypothetical protein
MSVRAVKASLPTRGVFAGVAVVALSVAGLLYWKGQGVPAANAASSEIRALRAELDAVREHAERSRVVREIRTEQAPTPAAAAGEPPAPEEPELTPEELEHRQKVFNEARSANMEASFQREDRDPEWSESALRSVRATYSEKSSEGFEFDVDCKSTLCRVAFRYTAAHTGPGSPIPRERPWPGRAFSHFNTTRNEGVMYVAREGFELPDVDPKSIAY